MAVPSISTYMLRTGSHYYGSTGGASVDTNPSYSVTKVTAIVSQTSGGAAIETVDTTVKVSSDQFADRWAVQWPTTGISSSPYYVRFYATNADGDGPEREVNPYIYFPPAVAITAPANASTLTSGTVTMAWTAYDDYGISAQTVSVLHGADVLLEESVGENDTTYAIPSSVSFVDGESYTFRVTARNGKGMEASADSTCDFSFDAPAAAKVTITDDGSTATIAVDDPHYSESGATIAVDGSAIADSFTVYGASVQDGTPTPSTPVPIESVEGWNLLDDSNIYNLAVSGNSIVANANYRGAYCEIPTTTGDTKFTISRNVVEGNRFQVWSAATEPVAGTTTTACFTWDNTALTATFTVPAGQSWLFVYLANNGGTFTPDNIQIVSGSQPLPIIPYGSIAAYIKDADNVTTTYPIDLQGNALRSLPDGTKDELVVENGTAKIVQRCEETNQAVTDGVTGTVGVDVLSSTGQIANGAQVIYKLGSEQEIPLGSVSDFPFIPEDGEMWVDGTTMDASLRPADYAGQPPISSVDIARVNPDGMWTLAEGVTEGQSAVDPLPPLGVAYRYAITSYAAGGGTKVGYVEHTVETRAWHLNFGDAAQEHVSYLYNPQATMTLTQGGESYHFADGGAGRGLPVFYPTTDRDMSGTLQFDTVLYGDSDILLDLCDRYPVAWLRDPFGHRWRAHVRPSVSHGVGELWPVTIAWDAVRFEEA